MLERNLNESRLWFNRLELRILIWSWFTIYMFIYKLLCCLFKMLCSCIDVKYCCRWVYWIDGCPNSSILSCDLILFFYAYSENAGLVGLTRVGSRRVIQISAGFMLLFSVLGVVFHIALFYFLFSHYFFTEIIEFHLSLQSMLLDSLFILSWLSTTVLLKRLLFFSPIIRLEVLINLQIEILHHLYIVHTVIVLMVLQSIFYRKIWGCSCFYTIANYGSSLLCPLRLCG
jgi:hypothetical protein